MRVVALLPGQGLQPHAHDTTEDITLRSTLNLHIVMCTTSFGLLAYFTWLEGPGTPTNRTVRAGEAVGCSR